MLYKDEKPTQLFRNEYEAVQHYGPSSTFALKARNYITLPFVSYNESNAHLEWDGQNGYKVTKVSSTTSNYLTGMRNLSVGTRHKYVLKEGHIYFFCGDLMTSRIGTNQSIYWEFYYNSGNVYFTTEDKGMPTEANKWFRVHGRTARLSSITETNRRDNCLFVYGMRDADGYQIGDWYKFRNFECFDLTEMYGYGNEPTDTGAEIDIQVHKDLEMDYLPPCTNSIYDYTYIPTSAKTLYSIGKQNQLKSYNFFKTKDYVSTKSDTRTAAQIYLQVKWIVDSVEQYGTMFECNLNSESTYPYHYAQIQTPPSWTPDSFKSWRYKHNGASSDLIIGDWTDNSAIMYHGHKYFLSCDFISADPTTIGGIQTDNMILLDLTDMFGKGNEPQSVEEVENILSSTGYIYHTGGNVNYFDFIEEQTISKGSYLVMVIYQHLLLLEHIT